MHVHKYIGRYTVQYCTYIHNHFQQQGVRRKERKQSISNSSVQQGLQRTVHRPPPLSQPRPLRPAPLGSAHCGTNRLGIVPRYGVGIDHHYYVMSPRYCTYLGTLPGRVGRLGNHLWSMTLCSVQDRYLEERSRV